MQNTNMHLVKAANGRVGALCRPDMRYWCVGHQTLDQIDSKFAWGTAFLMVGLNRPQPDEPLSHRGGEIWNRFFSASRLCSAATCQLQ
jgi:hypothetical protein